MKKLLKGFFVLVGALIVIGLISAIANSNNDSNGNGSKPKETKTTETAAPPQTKPQPQKKANPVSKDNYNKIVTGDAITGKGGMTIQQVEAILGKPSSQTESTSGDYKIEMLVWTSPDMAGISVSFINGNASDKTWMQ